EKKGKTFRWSGSYEYDMNEAKTLKTELNALTEFSAMVPEAFKSASHLFLGNIDPALQLKVIEQMDRPELIVIDTMNLWIEHKKEELLKAIQKSNILVFNEGEARMLFDTPSLVKAGKESLALGLDAVIIKKGEHGSLMFTKNSHFNAPGYPLENLRDPTGCGDSFGGGLIGYLAKHGTLDERALRKGIILGSTIASFNAEAFGVDSLRTLQLSDIEKRFEEIKKMREF
ncbi:MAG: PfkB family carbohydrate kinase, partial [Nanoarchaeota archaeon]